MRWALLFLVFLPLSIFSLLHRETAAPTAFGDSWAVSSAHPIATEVGAAVLARGGTAVDAAVAVSFALAVVFPEAGNLGGGFFGVGYQVTDATHWMIDAREAAPGAITYGTFVTLAADAALRGPYAAGVPGTVAGLAAMHRRHGLLPWAQLVTPATALAAGGYRLTAKAALKLQRHRDSLGADPAARRQFYATEPVAGAVVLQPDLAETLRRLGERPDDFYTGKTAELIVADALRYGGAITGGDLAAYEARWRRPIRCRYRAFHIVSAAPPSSGGVILCQTAQILEPFLLGALPGTGVTATHLTVEAWRQAFHDRRLLGDPDFVTAPVGRLISPAYGRRIAELIDLKAPGLVGEPERPYAESPETTHFSIVDAYGNAVAVTTTLNAAYGNKHVVEGAGFLLNNEMDDFNTRPGMPNLYGLVQGEANTPAPGKRMLSSMAPTLVFHGDRLVLVVGTPGGSTIPTTVWQVLTRLIDGGWVLDRAVAWPRFHHQGVPDAILHEPAAFGAAVADGLASMGYALRSRDQSYGDVHAIAWNTGRNQWMAVADPRGEGSPAAK